MPRGEDVFLRFYTRFILEDARFLRHGLAARAVFLHLSAVAVSRRIEFLPERYDEEALAIGMRCQESEVAAGLAELIAAKREPLIERLRDGRLRIVDVRKCHGENFRWEPDAEAFHAWALETSADLIRDEDMRTTYPRTGTNGDKRGLESPKSRGLPEVRCDRLDVDVKGEPSEHAVRRKANGVPGNTPEGTTEAKATEQHIPPTPDGVYEPDWQSLMAIARHWPVGGRDGGARRLGALLLNGLKYAEARVRMVDAAWKSGKLKRPGKPGLPWGVLGRSGYDPPDEEPVTPDRGRGEPEQIGSLLAKAGCDPPGEG